MKWQNQHEMIGLMERELGEWERSRLHLLSAQEICEGALKRLDREAEEGDKGEKCAEEQNNDSDGREGEREDPPPGLASKDRRRTILLTNMERLQKTIFMVINLDEQQRMEKGTSEEDEDHCKSTKPMYPPKDSGNCRTVGSSNAGPNVEAGSAESAGSPSPPNHKDEPQHVESSSAAATGCCTGGSSLGGKESNCKGALAEEPATEFEQEDVALRPEAPSESTQDQHSKPSVTISNMDMVLLAEEERHLIHSVSSSEERSEEVYTSGEEENCDGLPPSSSPQCPSSHGPPVPPVRVRQKPTEKPWDAFPGMTSFDSSNNLASIAEDQSYSCSPIMEEKEQDGRNLFSVLGKGHIPTITEYVEESHDSLDDSHVGVNAKPGMDDGIPALRDQQRDPNDEDPGDRGRENRPLLSGPATSGHSMPTSCKMRLRATYRTQSFGGEEFYGREQYAEAITCFGQAKLALLAILDASEIDKGEGEGHRRLMRYARFRDQIDAVSACRFSSVPEFQHRCRLSKLSPSSLSFSFIALGVIIGADYRLQYKLGRR